MSVEPEHDSSLGSTQPAIARSAGAGSNATSNGETERPQRRIGRHRAPWLHRAAELALRVAAGTAIAAIGLIVVFIAKEALPLFFDREARDELGGWSGLLLPRAWPGYDEPTLVWQPIGYPGKFGIVPLLIGTLKTTVLTMFLSLPVGIGSAIFVSQYAPRRAREWIKPTIEMLAGVPSVVIGFFALLTLASWMQSLTGATYRLNASVAALGLSITVIPVVFTVSEDALQAVPRSLVLASSALGARRWQTTLRVVVPAAIPGLAAAAVLGFGRAIGETMIVLMASGNAAVIDLFDPTSSARTITATIATELGEVGHGDPHWQVLFLLGLLLFLITFALNRLGERVVAGLRSRLNAEADTR